jgi:hypothetical protein
MTHAAPWDLAAEAEALLLHADGIRLDDGVEVPKPTRLPWLNAWQLGCCSATLKHATHPLLAVRQTRAPLVRVLSLSRSHSLSLSLSLSPRVVRSFQRRRPRGR